MKALAAAGAGHFDTWIFLSINLSDWYYCIEDRAERYAVHKLIVAVERQDQVKSKRIWSRLKRLLKHSLPAKRPLELASAWQTEWDSGPRWRTELKAAGHAFQNTRRRISTLCLHAQRRVERDVHDLEITREKKTEVPVRAKAFWGYGLFPGQIVADHRQKDARAPTPQSRKIRSDGVAY
jgi:hypothetical protein